MQRLLTALRKTILSDCTADIFNLVVRRLMLCNVLVWINLHTYVTRSKTYFLFSGGIWFTWKPSGTFRFPVFNEARKWGRKWVSEICAWKWRRKWLERWPLRTQLPVYFQFTSGKGLNHRFWTAGSTGRWIKIVYIFMVSHEYFKGFSFFSQFTSGNDSENLPETSRNAHQREKQKT